VRATPDTALMEFSGNPFKKTTDCPSYKMGFGFTEGFTCVVFFI